MSFLRLITHETLLAVVIFLQKFITLRAAGHHPDIPAYLGGKAGLYREVSPHAVATMAARGLPQTFDKPSSTLTRLIRLAAWLEEDDSGCLASAAVLHPKSIGLREHQFAEHFALETHIAEPSHRTTPTQHQRFPHPVINAKGRARRSSPSERAN